MAFFHLILKFFLNTTPTKSIGDIFGSPQPPPGGPSFDNPMVGLSGIISFGIRMFLAIGMITVLFFLLGGTYDWITSGGEEEKIENARKKITNAVLGIILMVVALGIFTVVGQDILGLIGQDADGGWTFSLPTIDQVPSTAP